MIMAPIGKNRTNVIGASTAWALMTISNLPCAPPSSVVESELLSDEEEEEDDDELEVVEATVVVKGLELLPPAAFWRLSVVSPYLVCCETEALTLFEETAEPVL
jgi:hypothetical protein